MTIKEASEIFATQSRLDAVKSILDDKTVRRISFSGLVGSAPAVLFASLCT